MALRRGRVFYQCTRCRLNQHLDYAEGELITEVLPCPRRDCDGSLVRVSNPWVKPIEKPPLGLKPREIWEEEQMEQRMATILNAITRFAKASCIIPVAWLEELNSLIERRNRRVLNVDDATSD
jgi:hypothetical protein